MESNNLVQFALGDHSDEEIVAAFTRAKFPSDLVNDLKAYLAVADFPLAVRSSSLLEDSHYQPFAGIYDTYFLPNNYHSLRGRIARLLAAIMWSRMASCASDFALTTSHMCCSV